MALAPVPFAQAFPDFGEETELAAVSLLEIFMRKHVVDRSEGDGAQIQKQDVVEILWDGL